MKTFFLSLLLVLAASAQVVPLSSSIQIKNIPSAVNANYAWLLQWTEGTSIPGTCAVGMSFYKTDTKVFYDCTDVNVFVLRGSGGSSMVYPSAGIPNSSGSAWNSSFGVVTTLGSPGSDTNIASERGIRAAISTAISSLATVASTGNYTDLSNRPTLGSIASHPTTDFQTTLGFTPENVTNKGIANGYAGLDSTGKVPSAQLPQTYSITGPITLTGSGSGAGALDLATGVTPSSPASGNLSLFFNSANSNHLSTLDPSNNVVDLQAGGGGGGTTVSVQSGNLAPATRTLNTTYQNTNAYPIWVSAMCNSIGTTGNLQAQTDSSPTPSQFVAIHNGNNWAGVQFIVLPGNYYNVNFNGLVCPGGTSNEFWTEWH